MTSLPPSLRHVRGLPGQFYTRSEAAKMLNVTPRTLRYWIGRDGLQAPSRRTRMGRSVVYLYSEADIEELRGHLARNGVVERTDWSDDDEHERRQQRERLYAQRYYHRRKRDEAAALGDTDEVQRRDIILDRITHQLTALKK